MNTEYPIIPGRGLVTESATQMRLAFLKAQDMHIAGIAETNFAAGDIRNNIESLVGSVEIPVGLVGPLLFKNNDAGEMVYTLAATLEGALVASMNRGAKALSLSGGFSAYVLHQKMIRTPMFIFKNLHESAIFKTWIEANFDNIKHVAEQYSNHAKLTSILTFVVGKSVHLKFVYTTGDATGQNMSTACTWHATLWIQKNFEQQKSIEIVHYVIEGNGASDKKVSGFSINHGRGIHVVAETHLREDVINKILRTTSDDIVRCFNQSLAMSRLDSMVGYNINVANAIAAIFAATGQDLGSIHESACGILNVEKTDEGLYLSLNLPTLVIGTIGGGTHLKCQREALELMNCFGNGKMVRFAQLIAGFALSLEISTYAAIVSGQFAKAHEKLGRNKPVNWLLKAEIDRKFVETCLNGSFKNRQIQSLAMLHSGVVDNGILMNLTSRISNKLIGFYPFDITHNETESSEAKTERFLLKSKPLDEEVFKGLHFMAAAINTELADLISAFKSDLEYKNCHKKEILLYELLHKLRPQYSPKFYGKHIDEKREIYLFIQEFLKSENLILFNSENSPEAWKPEYIENVIRAITEIHQVFSDDSLLKDLPEIRSFKPWNAAPLYRKMVELAGEDDELISPEQTAQMLQMIENLEQNFVAVKIAPTIIHNDCNPRNTAVRTDGTPCFYDWELAVVNIPHRDIVEFLSFAMPENFDQNLFKNYLHFHFSLCKRGEIWSDWKCGYEYALKEFLVTRVSFYLTGSILMKYEFAPRIFKNSMRMLELLKTL
ncbi:MAG TPA: phosphotransferase [Patescibacteria group bacterium]|nr:phosphotransferase [Patescibacteria group bacterium]